MVKRSKIEIYGLEDETVKLKNSGLSTPDIAEELLRQHPEIKKLSHMSVDRWLKKHKVELKEKRIKEGKDLDGDLRKEYVEKMKDLDYETHEIYNIMRKELKYVIEEGNSIKTIKAAKDTLDAIDKSRKNLRALIQWGLNEFRTNEKAKQQTTINIDKLLINFSKELCPTCRKKVLGLVTKEDTK
jgi:hypothetical protein